MLLRAKLFGVDLAPGWAGAEPIAAGGLFGDRIAAVAAAVELFPGEADLDAAHPHHRVVGLLALLLRTAIQHVDHAGLADLAAALRAVHAFDTERAALQKTRNVTAMNLTAGFGRQRRTNNDPCCESCADNTPRPCHNRTQ